MVDNSGTQAVPAPRRLGASLRQAWVGYQIRLDTEMAAAGFADRRFPDGRVLLLCAQSDDVTISDVGRVLGITRQGASKVVASLVERGYVSVAGSAADAREKIVSLTPLARGYLEAHRVAADRIERGLYDELGPEPSDALERLLAALSVGSDVRMRDYIRAHRSDVDLDVDHPA